MTVDLPQVHPPGATRFLNPLMSDIVEFVRARFAELADPKKAGPMAAYMKTTMPFYGIQKPEREVVYRELKKRLAVDTQADYRRTILALWSQPHREEKYAAIFVAQHYSTFIGPPSLPLYRRMIIEGAWWDFVDDIGIRLVGRVVLHHRGKGGPLMDRWIDDRDMWVRRSALISHISHESETDQRQLFDHCLRRAHEKEFFIRKAIGWTLRHYARTAPDQVARFLTKHKTRLSPLSYREAGKHLGLA